MKHHRKPYGALYRASRDGQAKHDGFLDDYAFLAQALIEGTTLITSDAQLARYGPPTRKV